MASLWENGVLILYDAVIASRTQGSWVVWGGGWRVGR